MIFNSEFSYTSLQNHHNHSILKPEIYLSRIFSKDDIQNRCLLYKKAFNITSHQENENKNYSDISPHIC